MGSTALLVDPTDTVADAYTYDAFGNLVSGGSGIANPFRYLGGEGYYSHQTTTLLQTGARYYLPSLGRFISEDPIGFAGGLNPYLYCDNDPVNLSDPTGLDPSMLDDVSEWWNGGGAGWDPSVWDQIRNWLYWKNQGAGAWYMGGMGGATDWLDRSFFSEAAEGFGSAVGNYEQGRGDLAPAVLAGANTGYRLVSAALLLENIATFAGKQVLATRPNVTITHWDTAERIAEIESTGILPSGTYVEVGGNTTRNWLATLSWTRGYRPTDCITTTVPREALQKTDFWLGNLLGHRVVR